MRGQDRSLWRNWSGSVRAPAKILYPLNEEELAQAIGRYPALRALGAGHSFMPLCETGGALIHLGKMDAMPRIAHDRKTATVPAGWSIAKLTEYLWREGLSLANQGDVNPQALAGAMATGTHGTGAFGSLSTMARRFRLMDATGRGMWCSADDKPDLFAAQRLSLGLLGIATEIEVAVVPAFHLAERISKRRLASLRESYAEECAQHRHAEFWIFPYSDRAIFKTLDICDPCAPPRRTQDIGEGLFRALLNVGACFPKLTPLLQRTMMATNFKASRKGPAFQIFPSDRTITFEEMEYELPLENGFAALEAVMGWIRRKQWPVAFPFEFRTVAGDDIWLSPMNDGLGHKGPFAAISMHQYAKMEWRDIFREAEAIFRDHGGRPHWAKRHNLTREDVDQLYPMADAFRHVRRRMDPDGKFLNQHLRDLWA